MRLWSLHPRYLDAKGLVALWREALLAQAVLRGKTTGYRHHPQLQRFRAQPSPAAAIADYLSAVHEEATARGYRFDAKKIEARRAAPPIAVTRGQLEFEWRHLMAKLEARAPDWRTTLGTPDAVDLHPLFRLVPGEIADWERPWRRAPHRDGWSSPSFVSASTRSTTRRSASSSVSPSRRRRW